MNTGIRATDIGLYRPFTTLTYLFNYAAFGEGPNPAGYHVVNYAIHSMNATLVFLLALPLFGEIVPAFAMAAIWAVHPALTESVTNIVGRADLLGAFGLLAALLCFTRSRESVGRGGLPGGAPPQRPRQSESSPRKAPS